MTETAVTRPSTEPPRVVARGNESRPSASGKFLFAGNEKLYVRGVTYGAFRARENGEEYPEPDQVRRDLAQMAENGINAVRTYTVPPRSFLDLAHQFGLRVMVGLPVELYVGLLTERRGAPDVARMVRDWVSGCAGHPAVLCYAIGNEIPAALVRWHGSNRIERFLKRMYDAVKAEDTNGLVTYVNYPSTEYLQLPFLDLVCFNVYLESQPHLERYLARLQNVAGDRPLIMSEIGLDSRRNGEDTQATTLDWQIRTSFSAGCAGAFVYAWTDEWFAGGSDVLDWDFGLVDRERRPKSALLSVADAFASAPLSPGSGWPMISVVVCTYNGARTIAEVLDGLDRQMYSRYEVIVVDDGSTDATADIAWQFDVRVIRTENGGLSAARNIGMAAAAGEIVAYIDDDARPDQHWLDYLAFTFMSTDHAAVGGPNIPPVGDGPIADCVARAPGGPLHVLLTDQEAEHVPGCNLAVRKSSLEAIRGFDPRFRSAGDDVDLCWRLQEHGWTVGFNAAAMVWHHRRNSIRAYWRQQVGYGHAEALLEAKWPDRYNALGHLSWRGRLYGRGAFTALGRTRGRIYQGTWGSAPFQSLYQPRTNGLQALPVMPEWYLVAAVLAVIASLGLLWAPLTGVLPLFAVVVGAPVVYAGLRAARISLTDTPTTRMTELRMRLLIAMLHLIQPLARLCGRMRHGLTPWRRRGHGDLALPRPWTTKVWSELWRSPDDRRQLLLQTLRGQRAVVRSGGDFDRWDLEVRGGLLAAVRILMAVEEHHGGAQLVRLRTWPRWVSGGLVLIGLTTLLALAALLSGASVVAVVFGLVTLAISCRMLWEGAAATALVKRAFEQSHGEWDG